MSAASDAILATYLLVTAVASPVVAQQPDARRGDGPTASQAYLDETARYLMEGARGARDSALSDIEAYTAVVSERWSAEAAVLVRDRPIVRFESTTRVRWSKDGPTVLRVLGSRMEIGGQRFKPRRPEGTGARFASDPLHDPFSLFLPSMFGSDYRESWFVPSVTPLDDDDDRFYQFRSGDTISVLLADGESVQAVSVTASPRFLDLGLVFAVLWIDPDTFGVVRTIYRPAKAIESEVSFRFGGDWDAGIGLVVEGKPLADREAPSPLPPSLLERVLNYGYAALVPRLELGMPAAVVDYTLWNSRYWLPRRASFAAYGVGGDEMDAEYSETLVTAQARQDWDCEIEEISTADGHPATTVTIEELVRSWREPGDTVEVKDGSEPDSGTVVIVPRDWRALAASDLLPPSIWEERESGIYAGELQDAAETLDPIGVARFPGGPADAEVDRGASSWSFDPPVLSPALLRYNPVEGLSVGTRLLRDHSWGRSALTVRTATRRTEPSVDLSVERGRTGPRLRFSLYRILRATGGRVAGRRPERLELAADSSWYYQAQGAAVQLLPARSERLWTSLRVFSETTTTLYGDTRRRTGADVYVKPWWGGFTGRRVNGGADFSLQGVMGDYPSVRLSVTGMLVLPLSTGWSTAVEVGGAHIWGDPAPEEIWRLGGSGDWLRGYPRVVLRGPKVWRSRVEFQRRVSLAAVSAFHDWASVDGSSLQSFGIGISLLNGFLRADLARPVSPWYEQGVRVPGKPRVGVDWAHHPEWKWHLRVLAPF
ncbi:MAG: hypothetical protein OXR82_16145 [Gammaproteobacteria bacterium]|nr:hypothetical protein [Gammaproteobacteria bacterium]MDE0259903.1 hypothetical protein [Gammaproteobacteria bacterium]